MMTNEELNERVREKLLDDQRRYREWLLTLPAEEMLAHAYEFCIREDFIEAAEAVELTDRQAQSILRSEKPLDDLFENWRSCSYNYIDDMCSAIETYADDCMEAKRTPSRDVR